MDDQPQQLSLRGFDAIVAPNPDGAVFAADLTGEPPAASGAVPEAAAPEGTDPPNPQSAIRNPQSGEALTAYSALLRAQPDLIPELVGGATLAEIEASATAARAAYAGVRERVLQAAQGPVPVAQAAAPAALSPVRGFAAIAAGVRVSGQ
jgi:hypothetical protein